MRHLGRLTDWNDAKGFGFVEPNGGGERAFVHIKAFERRTKRPENGDLISYELQRDGRDRFNAVDVRFATAHKRVESTGPATLPRKTIATLFVLALLAAWWFAKVPDFVLGIYGVASVVAFGAYARDKAAARDGAWRTSENKLHLFALLGGWPGALVAQDVFRHKSAKASFQLVFWLTVAINCAGMVWLLRQ